MKRFLSALLVLALSCGLTACSYDIKEDVYQDDNNLNIDEETNNVVEEVSNDETEQVAKIA